MKPILNKLEIEKLKLETKRLKIILNIVKGAYELANISKPSPCFANGGPGLSKWDERAKTIKHTDGSSTIHGCAVKQEYTDPLPMHNNIIILSDFKNSTNGILTIGNLDNWLRENKYKIVKEK